MTSPKEMEKMAALERRFAEVTRENARLKLALSRAVSSVASLVAALKDHIPEGLLDAE